MSSSSSITRQADADELTALRPSAGTFLRRGQVVVAVATVVLGQPVLALRLPVVDLRLAAFVLDSAGDDGIDDLSDRGLAFRFQELGLHMDRAQSASAEPDERASNVSVPIKLDSSLLYGVVQAVSRDGWSVCAWHAGARTTGLAQRSALSGEHWYGSLFTLLSVDQRRCRRFRGRSGVPAEPPACHEPHARQS